MSFLGYPVFYLQFACVESVFLNKLNLFFFPSYPTCRILCNIGLDSLNLYIKKPENMWAGFGLDYGATSHRFAFECNTATERIGLKCSWSSLLCVSDEQ